MNSLQPTVAAIFRHEANCAELRKALVVSSRTPDFVPWEDLLNGSFRQALATLASTGILLKASVEEEAQ